MFLCLCVCVSARTMRLRGAQDSREPEATKGRPPPQCHVGCVQEGQSRHGCPPAPSPAALWLLYLITHAIPLPSLD